MEDQSPDLGRALELSLGVLGDSARRALMFNLETSYGIRLRDPPLSTQEDIESALRNMFGEGSSVIIRTLRSILEAGNVFFQRKTLVHFQDLGIDVIYGATRKGNSGQLHYFDIVFSNKKDRAALQVIRSDSESDILSAYTKATDCGFKNIFLLLGKPSDAIIDLAKYYRLTMVRADTTDVKLVETVSAILHEESKGAPDPS